MKFKKTVMSAALEEMMAFPEEQVEPLTEEEVQVFEDTEGDELVEGINVAVEAIEQLECLIATMEAAAQDQNFGKYNLPLYQNSLENICKSLGTKVTGLSQEAFGDDVVLSTEGLKDMASKVIKTIKALIARFVTWYKNTYTSKNAVILKFAKNNVNKLSKLNKENWNPEAVVSYYDTMFCGFFYPVGKGALKSVAVMEQYLDLYVKDMNNQIEAVQDAINLLSSNLPCSKEKFEGFLREKVSSFAELVGPASKIHTYVTLAKNEDDTREGGPGNKDHTNITVGSFSDMEKVCTYLKNHSQHNWGGRVNTIASEINSILHALEKMQADGIDIDNSILSVVSKSITAVSFVFHDTGELMYHANRIVEKALRAGVGEDNKHTGK